MNSSNPPGLVVSGPRIVGQVPTATGPNAADWEFTNGTYPPPPAPGTTFSINSNGGSGNAGGGPPGPYTSPFASAAYGAGEMPSSNDPWSVLLFLESNLSSMPTWDTEILLWGNHTDGILFRYTIGTSSFVVWNQRGFGGTTAYAFTVPNLFDGRPHAIIPTFDGTDLSLWLDGVLIDRVPAAFVIAAGAAAVNLGTDTITGSLANKQCFTGNVDELAIFDYCLTDAQVQKLFQAGANIYAAEQDLSPIHGWHFDETAFPCADWAGNAPMVAGTGGSQDSATVTFHQTPLAGATYVPPQGNLNGLTVSGVPSAGQELVATSPTTANWQTPPASGVSQIVPGARMTVSPGGGTGVVTVDAAPAATPVVFADSPYTPASNKSLWLLCDTTGGPIVINLPAASTDGDQIDITNVGPGPDTVDATALGLNSPVIPDAAVSARYFGAGPGWLNVGPSCAFNAASPDGTTIQVVNGVASAIGGGGVGVGEVIVGLNETSTSILPSPLINTDGTPVVMTPTSPATAFADLLGIAITGAEASAWTTTGVNTGAGEVLSLSMLVTWSNASTLDLPLLSTTPPDNSPIPIPPSLGLFKDGLTIVSVAFRVQSSIALSIASATVTLVGTQASNIALPATAGLTLYSDTAPSPVWERGEFNVLAFGADPTGVTSSSVAFSNAIAQAGTGGTVYAPGGTYKLDAGGLSLINCNLVGDGMDVTTLAFTALGSQNPFSLQQATLTNLSVRNLDGSGTHTMACHVGAVSDSVHFYGFGTSDPGLADIINGPAWIRNCLVDSYALATGQKGLISVPASVSQLYITDNQFATCAATVDPTSALVYMGANVTDFEVTGNLAPGSTYNYGAYIAAGASERYFVVDNEFTAGAVTLPVFDGGTGTNKLVNDNPLRTGGGSSINAPVTETTTYPMAAADSGVLADATSAGFTVTLPVTPTAGQTYFVKKIDSTANVVTIVGSSGTIDGAASATISVQYQSMSFVFDSANWWLAA